MIRRCSTRRKRNPEAGIIHQAIQKLNDEQIQEYKEAFLEVDKDNNGKISTRELKNLLRSLGCNPTDLEIQEIINEVDANGNGTIDFPEFINLMKKMTKPSEDHASTLDAFRVFDNMEKGNISSKCIREIMIKSLDPIPQTEIEDLLASLGLSSDRVISYEEFSKFVSPPDISTVTTEHNIKR
ncbi:uncharacterized protein [Clytia hemisphaerica]|uniref:uncharacterized protein n=1 Tax=Clytia hemisphaerica TaxID=252671 RepID=UPI0034D430E7